ncbi:hypothetical protein Mmc1_3208 [Magnetococcus marinus MC-1]|uniref:Uncharacterized protein n=1 Tax=Magnetococcus marinus (strain ATCC BAA-1437 / JCM 17883 / MC-1) TaxID=156889 RepID=A0LCK5_MAGMM|nr:hypothetical protein [Magnetococcus marinus]ABK45698.1 hypothetical protein Mmc1_3208 [Magnetococcus marinus MC-1]
MKFDLQQQGRTLAIDIQPDNDAQAVALLKQFESCRAGHCTCASAALSNLDDMQVNPQHNGHIRVELTAREGSRIQASDVAKCIVFSAPTEA